MEHHLLTSDNSWSRGFSANAFSMRGVLMDNLNRFDEAIVSYERARLLDSTRDYSKEIAALRRRQAVKRS
jgi:hypothetical protein